MIHPRITRDPEKKLGSHSPYSYSHLKYASNIGANAPHIALTSMESNYLSCANLCESMQEVHLGTVLVWQMYEQTSILDMVFSTPQSIQSRQSVRSQSWEPHGMAAFPAQDCQQKTRWEVFNFAIRVLFPLLTSTIYDG